MVDLVKRTVDRALQGHSPVQQETCEVTALGYTCDRAPGHGAIHHQPERQFGPPMRETWWILEARCECELMGRNPMTGYRIVNDSKL